MVTYISRPVWGWCLLRGYWSLYEDGSRVTNLPLYRMQWTELVTCKMQYLKVDFCPNPFLPQRLRRSDHLKGIGPEIPKWMKRPGENWGKINFFSTVKNHGPQDTDVHGMTKWPRPITLRYTLIVKLMRMRRWTRHRTRDIQYLERSLHKLGLRA